MPGAGPAVAVPLSVAVAAGAGAWVASSTALQAGLGGALGLGAGFAGTLVFSLSVGVFTFFAPCAYPLLPGYVGFYASQERADLRGAVVRGVAAAAGAFVVLAAVAGVVLAAGGSLVAGLTELEPVIGAALVVLGLLMLSGRAPEVRVLLPQRRSSVPGFALFGAVYALAAAGCVVPAFVGVVTQSLTLPPLGAGVALAAYAGGVAVPLVVVTILAALGSDAFRSVGRHLGEIQRLAGAVMVLAGLWQVWRSLEFLGYL
jgi:cytochrome c-type biogenesis protein